MKITLYKMNLINTLIFEKTNEHIVKNNTVNHDIKHLQHPLLFFVYLLILIIMNYLI